MKKIVAFCLGALLLCVALCGCQKAPVEKTSYVLGTICAQTVYADEACVGEGENLLFVSEDQWSWRKADSIVARINDNAGQWTEVDEDTFRLLQLAKDVAVQSGGALDITIGRITGLWDFTSEEGKLPKEEELKEALPFVDYTTLELDEERRAVRIGNNQKLDLGAVAKGAAANRLAQYYREKGIGSALLNLGGNIYAVGRKPGGAKWKLGLRDPKGSGADYFATVEIEDTSVVVSGGYERYFEVNGKKYHHLLDPKTGYPAESGLLCSCIVTEDSALGDALSTAVYILGEKKGMELASRYGADCLLLTEDGRAVMSEGFAEKYKLEWSRGTEYAHD